MVEEIGGFGAVLHAQLTENTLHMLLHGLLGDVHGYRATELFDWPWRWGRRRLREQGGEPGLIEEHFLVRRFPEGADLLGFATGRKGPLVDGQRKQGFEVLGLGITAAGLPASHRFSG